MRLLDWARPDGNRSIFVVAAPPAEGLRFGPRAADDLQGFVEASAGFRRVDVVRHVFIGGSAQHTGDDAPVGEGIEHGEFLGDAHWILDWNIRTEERDFGALDAL